MYSCYVNVTGDKDLKHHSILRGRAAAALTRDAVSRLTRQTAELQALVHGLPDAVCIANHERITYANEAALELLGADARVLYRPGLRLCERLDARWYASQQRVPESESPMTLALQGQATVRELSLRSLAGRGVVVRCASSPIRLGSRVTGAICVLTDITVQKQNEAAVRESEARFRSLAVTSSDLVWSTGPDSETLSPSGWDFPGQLAGDDALEAIHPEDRERVQQQWIDATNRGVAFRAEYLLRRADGEYRHMLARGVPVIDEHGEVREWIGIAVDLTEKRRAEELTKQKAELERQLVGIVSHDLASPLTIIAMAAARSAAVPGLPGVVVDGLRRILSASQRAERMLHDLLDFTRARLGGSIPVFPQDVELGALVTGLAEELRVGASGRKINVDIQGETRGEWDGDRLAQVVTNLVVNALRYSPADSAVDVRVAGEGGRVVLEVCNQGAPIPPSLLPRLFDPLIRGDHRPAREGTGLGLGLYIVRQIVNAHHGEIEVRSAAEGTTFRITLPKR
jgi:PAS domain S-box-containing protein